MRFTRKDLEQLKQRGLIRDYIDNGEEKKKKNKYAAEKVEMDGYVFDSRKESREYIKLRHRLNMGEITELQVHVEFVLWSNGVPVASYFADFTYKENGQLVVVDAKSAATRKIKVYRLKKKLMKATYNIDVIEV
jgi:hypothetical protein